MNSLSYIYEYIIIDDNNNRDPELGSVVWGSLY